jgi:alginate O-acetyltransferase complex protein AlgJ
MDRSKKSANKVLIAAFLIIIYLPIIVDTFGIKTGQPITENRAIEPMPSLEINYSSPSPGAVYIACVRFIRKFDDHYNSTFGFRSNLLQLYNTVKQTIFDTDPLPQKVVKGTDGWYFLGDSNSNVIKESKGIENFSPEELKASLQKILGHKLWLQKRDIQYYLAVAPNKASIYGEYLAIQKSKKETQLDQLKFVSQNNFNFIDLKSHFSLAPHARLYHKTDSHWNDYGAFLAYSSLIERVKADFPEVHRLTQSDFLIDTTSSYQQDLTRMLFLKVKEEVITFETIKPERALLQKEELNVPKNYDRAPIDYEKRYKTKINTLKVVVLHDSFTLNLIKFLKESFGETVFIWRPNFDKELIEREKPDIVIQIVVERNLDILRH